MTFDINWCFCKWSSLIQTSEYVFTIDLPFRNYFSHRLQHLTKFCRTRFTNKKTLSNWMCTSARASNLCKKNLGFVDKVLGANSRFEQWLKISTVEFLHYNVSILVMHLIRISIFPVVRFLDQLLVWNDK